MVKKNQGTVILSRPVLPGDEKEQKKKGSACIVLLHPPGPDIGRRTPLKGTNYLVGRETDADLIVNRSSVSRQHARLSQAPGGEWTVQDLGSTNGTFVNEERIGASVGLGDGDQVRFGDAIYKFLIGSNVESAYHEEIYRMTILDGLTNVHNKRYFLDFLERELASAHRHGHALAVVMIDIDHFKAINDNRGHLCGDEALKEMCNRIRPRIRREDLFARYGGEEFAAVLTVTDLAGGVRFAESLRRMIESQAFTFEDQSFPVTVSLGVAAIQGEPDIGATSLIKRADENLYRAKEGGRNRVVPSMADLGITH